MGIRPVPEQFRITQTYHANATIYNLGRGHGAVDFGVPIGTEVVSIAAGVVWFADWAWNLPGGPDAWPDRLYQIKPSAGDTKSGGGIITIVEHDDVFALYAHLGWTPWNKGQRVAQGQVLGTSHTTGSSTGPHLHFAIIPKPANWGNGYFGHIDPMPYIRQQYRKLVPGAPADTSGASMNGIDYSNWQPALDPARVPADFIGVLATDGKSFKSPTLKSQMPAAMAQTKRTMVYHFARAGQSDSDTQARHFLKVAKKYIDAGAVPVLDWEEEEFNGYAQWAIDWIRYVEKATGRQVWVYQRQDAAANRSWGSFRRPMWLARYPTTAAVNGYLASFKVPPVPGWDVVIWQYSDNGWLPGYDGPLDLNVAFGDPWQLAKGVGTATREKDWFDMADKNTLKDALRELIPEITRAVLDAPIDLKGRDPDTGEAYTGRTSLRNEASWGTFRGYRDRRIEADVNEIYEAVRPSNIENAVINAIETGIEEEENRHGR